MGETATMDLKAALRQLANVEGKLAELAAAREALIERIAELRRADGADPSNARTAGGRDAGDGGKTARPKRPADREAKMRLYWEAAAIIRSEGRPMTAPEIHGLHPMRAEFDTDTLYRALYKRVGTTLASHAGAFWPSGVALPDGWRPPPRRRRSAAGPAGPGGHGRDPTGIGGSASPPAGAKPRSVRR